MRVSAEHSHEAPQFPAAIDEILARIDAVDPVAYGRTRNFLDGAVSYLSPYISRGVISTRFVFERVLDRGFRPSEVEKFVQELTWRDYWQQVWLARGSAIETDLKRPQPFVANQGVPAALVQARTGIQAIDDGIRRWYETGYLHNHLRMYVAAIACNVAGSHWLNPARWMYYHLWDADWASNALSWQWVAGSNSGKQYVANQSNINKYCGTDQHGTFLDIPYESFSEFAESPGDSHAGRGIPEELREIATPSLTTTLPVTQTNFAHDPRLPTCIYDYYNMDPRWRSGEDANRVLLLEPNHFTHYPVSDGSIAFLLKLGENIPGLQVYAGSFAELARDYPAPKFFYKEHPLNAHYTASHTNAASDSSLQGPMITTSRDERDWMFPVRGYYPSFFAYWKKCRRHL